MLIKMFFDTVPLGKMSRVEMSFGQMPQNRDENREKGKKNCDEICQLQIWEIGRTIKIKIQ